MTFPALLSQPRDQYGSDNFFPDTSIPDGILDRNVAGNGKRFYGAKIQDAGGAVYNIAAFGEGVGEGNASVDTAAAQAAVNAARDRTGGGVIKFPSGSCRILGLEIPANMPFAFCGEGLSSEIVWAGAGHLFAWDTETSADQVTIQNLVITPGHAGNASHAVFNLRGGASRQTSFFNVRVRPATGGFNVGTVVDVGGLCDSIYITQCHWNGISKAAVIVHGTDDNTGSSLFITCSRFIGDSAAESPTYSRGVDVQGKFGGVYLTATDIYGFGTGVDIRDNGLGVSNREILILGGSLDTCVVGLNIQDASIVSWAGVYVSGCMQTGILVGSNNPQVILTGGLIWNSGANGLIEGERAHGLVINSGRVTLCGTVVRNNANVPNPNGLGVSVVDAISYSITGATLHDNYQGLADTSTGAVASVVGNIFKDNTAPNSFDKRPAAYRDNVFTGYGNDDETDDEPWTALALQHLWVNYGGSLQDTAGYRKQGTLVDVKGFIKLGTNTATTIIALLPYAPPKTKYFEVTGDGGPVGLRVDTDGNLRIDRPAAGNAYLSLNGISYHTT